MSGSVLGTKTTRRSAGPYTLVTSHLLGEHTMLYNAVCSLVATYVRTELYVNKRILLV